MTENLTDSIVSPLLFFSVFGLAGAAMYRAANTMDAMVGYRDERERIGWFAARMDDLFNFIPARITVLLLFVYFAFRGRLLPAVRMMRRDGRNRPGFNGGIVMAAMAGGLVSVSKNRVCTRSVTVNGPLRKQQQIFSGRFARLP